MFRMETEVDKERRSLLGAMLRASNDERSPVMRALRGSPAGEESPLDIWLTDETTGDLAGGLAARTWARWLHVDLLWIDGRHRGTGLGSRVLAEAERMARTERGCARARLETWDFQALGFYRKQHYEIAGQVADYPPGVTEYILVKTLCRPPGTRPGQDAA